MDGLTLKGGIMGYLKKLNPMAASTSDGYGKVNPIPLPPIVNGLEKSRHYGPLISQGLTRHL
jgi:hypothetical protein